MLIERLCRPSISLMALSNFFLSLYKVKNTQKSSSLMLVILLASQDFHTRQKKDTSSSFGSFVKPLDLEWTWN